MNESMFYWAAQYAARGWHVVVCHGQTDGKCTCGSRDCGTPGKHPVLGAWQDRATRDEDELAQWFDGSKPRNVGVQLGPKSGIVDIEYDTEEGERTAERYGLHKSQTPTFTSKRSTHRLFKWSDKLPHQAVFKFKGLEIRIGGGNRGSQSIFPPSAHHLGATYAWVDGMSPDEVDVAEFPADLLVAISGEVENAPKQDSAFAILHKKKGEGDRHDALVRFAARMCIQMVDCHDPTEQQDVLAMVRAMNTQQCVPPKGDAEIQDIFRHELRWAIRKRAAGVETMEEKKLALNERMEVGAETDTPPQEATQFTLTGLRKDDKEWWPGQWRLKVIHSDPVMYALTVPVFREVDGVQKTVFVTVTMASDVFRSAAKAADAILSATHTVMVDDVPEEWFKIWNGEGKRKDKPAIRGLKAKLLDEATHEKASPENCRFVQVAQWFLDVLCMTPQPDSPEDSRGPDITGMPSWVVGKDGEWELWFGWSAVWETVDKGRRKLEPGDMLKIKKMILAGVKEPSLPTGRGAGEGGRTKRFVRFTKDHIRVLERLAHGEFGAEGATAFSIHEEV